MQLRPRLAAALVMIATAPALAQQNPSFNVLNRSGQPIRELYVTPAGDANWGRNRLLGATIAPGASYAARRRIDGNCVFDMKIVFADGRAEERRSLNTCTVDDVAVGASPAANAPAANAPAANAPAAGIAGRKAADDPSFRLVNRGPQELAELYATPSGDANWGANRVAGAPLPAQTDRVVHVDRQASCQFDLKVVFKGGRTLTRRHADLCRMTDLPVP